MTFDKFKFRNINFIYELFPILRSFVLNDAAFWKILLWSVPSSSTSFPIMFNVFLLLSYEIFYSYSISVDRFAPYIRDLRIALIALLLEMLYLFYMGLSLFNGVSISLYWTYAGLAPTMRFLLMFGVIPPPLSMNGTSCAFVFSALVSYLFKCWPCVKFYSIIFPRYL